VLLGGGQPGSVLVSQGVVAEQAASGREMVAGFGGICKNSKPGHGVAGACRWLKAEYGGVAMVPTDE